MKGRFNNQPFLNQPKPKLNQKPNHLSMVSKTDVCSCSIIKTHCCKKSLQKHDFFSLFFLFISATQ
jgi:hypothetical protein